MTYLPCTRHPGWCPLPRITVPTIPIRSLKSRPSSSSLPLGHLATHGCLPLYPRHTRGHSSFRPTTLEEETHGRLPSLILSLVILATTATARMLFICSGSSFVPLHALHTHLAKHSGTSCVLELVPSRAGVPGNELARQLSPCPIPTGRLGGALANPFPPPVYLKAKPCES